ncbi:AraC family transcriptional regulator, partial [bacterium]|nr:AraC family transcriptional regulator [bacterium]
MIERFTGADGAHATDVPELTLYRLSAATEPVALVYEPSLCVIAQGSKDVRLADEVYHYDPAHFLLVSVDLPVAGCVVEATAAEPYLGLRVSLDPATVAELLADGAAADAPPGPPARGLAVTPADPPLLDAVARLVALLDCPRDAAALAPLVLREITYRLLTGPQGLRLLQIAASGGPARRVARAVRWL